jgi:ubiquinone/menaquinone biosynthesis C-methylase UbiE
MDRQHYERDYWQGCSTDPDVDLKYIADVDTKPCVDLINEGLSPFLKGDHVLDLGCGVGRLTIPLAERNPGAHFTGLDIAEGMLAIATSRAGGKARFVLGDGRTIPAPNESVHAAYSMLLFQHLPPEGITAYLGEASRVLSPGGRFFFQFIEGDESEPFSWHYSGDTMADWMFERGLSVEGMERGTIHDQWTWVTAVRG